MYTPTAILALLLTFSATTVLAVPQNLEVLQLRGSTNVNPAAVTGTTCTNKSVNIVDHDLNVATLAICGGIAGTIEKCNGSPASTVGASGTAKFTLNSEAGATINVSKGRWEGCIRAARATCPTGTFTSTCVGGASKGNVAFTLTQNN